jgi:molybdopterin biosynthesis enzyme
MLRSLFTVALSASVLLSVQAMADVYKYTDEHGNVQYTDKPATLPAERLNVRTQRTDTVSLQEREAQEQAQSDAAQRRTPEQRNAAQTSAAARAEQCTKARERFDRYMSSQRLYEELPNGERRYLSDAELDAARASAKASMEVLCK